MRKLVVLIAGVIIPAILTAQLMQEWVGTHSGPCAWTTDDFGQRVACDADGNVYVCWGGRGLTGSTDFITVKYGSDGSECWTRYYDGPDGGLDEANAIAVDASGIYVTGYCTDLDYDNDYATIKYDLDGNLLWHSHYDGGCGSDVARAIVVSGNAVYVTGCSNGSGTCDDYATIKYDAFTGSPVWSGTGIDQSGAARYDDGHGYDEASAIAVDASGAVYVTGKSAGSDWMSHYATVKYNTDGTLGWGALPGGAARYDGGYGSAYASAVAVDAASGAVYVTGTSAGSGVCDNDWATIKYDPSNGLAIWTCRYEESGNAFANAIAVDASGAVYVTGSSSGECTDYTTIKYNADGMEGWASPARYDGPDHLYDDAYAITVNSSGVYVTGFSTGEGTNDDYATVWYDADDGAELGAARYAGPYGSYDLSLSIASGPAGHVYVTGYCTDYNQFENIVTIGYIGERESGKPAAFNLTDPADAATDVPIEGNLTWEASTGADRYEVSLGGIVYQAATNSYHYSGLSNGTKYDWDVTAFNDGGSTASSNGPFSFSTIIEAPAAWAQWPDAPGKNPHRDIGEGAAMATDPDGLYAFLLKGNKSCDFYRYEPEIGAWAVLDPIPDKGRDHKKRGVEAGGTMAQVDGKFYATKGGNSLDFWEYNPAAGPGSRWTQMADVPAGAAGVQAGASAAGLTINGSGHVYLLKASGTFEFYSYDVASNAWQTMSAAPGQPGEEFGQGSSISCDGTDTIFALKGTLDKFYVYVVSTNTWLARSDLPLGPNGKQAKAGAAICYHMRRVYTLKGGNTQEFWTYNCDDNTWAQGSDVPLGPKKSRVQDGGALVYCRDSRYLFATKGSSPEFWSYGKLSNYGPQSPDGVAAVQLAGVDTYGLATASALVPGRDRVSFALPRPGTVSLKLYDMTGRVARVLVNGWQQAGRHEIALGAASLAQGTYIVRFAADDYMESRKLIVQR